MGKTSSYAFRIAIFAAGLAVLVLALVLLTPYSPGGMEAAVFTAVDAVALYVLLFAPLVLSGSISELTGGRIASLGIYWRAASLYCLLTIVVLVFANISPHPPFRVLIVVQLVGLVGLFLALYLGGATTRHIESVEQAELAKRASTERMRVAAESLSACLNAIDASRSDAHGDLVRLLTDIVDDVRYLSPVASGEAEQLDEQIATGVSLLRERVGQGDMDQGDVQETCALARSVQACVEQRKLLRSA